MWDPPDVDIITRSHKKYFVQPTHYNFPVLLVRCDLIGRPHLTVCGSSSHEGDDAGAGLGRALILLTAGPASVAGTGGGRASAGVLPLAAEEGELVVVELVLDRHLHDVLDHRGPPGHLICVLTGPLLSTHLPNLPAVSLRNGNLGLLFNFKSKIGN